MWKLGVFSRWKGQQAFFDAPATLTSMP